MPNLVLLYPMLLYAFAGQSDLIWRSICLSAFFVCYLLLLVPVHVTSFQTVKEVIQERGLEGQKRCICQCAECWQYAVTALRQAGQDWPRQHQY